MVPKIRTVVALVTLCAMARARRIFKFSTEPQAHCTCESSGRNSGVCTNLPKCEGNPFCSSIQNQCPFTVWARVAYGSPESSISTRKLEPGETTQLELLHNLPNPKGARLYLYYKEPPYVPENTSARTHQHFTQLTEFATHQRKGIPMIDYDVSGVDSTALPVYMNVQSNDRGRFCGPVGSFQEAATFMDGCPTEVIDQFNGQGTCNGGFMHCMKHFSDSAFCTKMDQIGSILGLPRTSRQIYGCQLNNATGFTREVCQRINLGQCQCKNPDDSCKDCNLPPSEHPEDWFKTEPYNTYAEWALQKGSYYSFSLFDLQANKQCLGTQLDVITCPQCSVSPHSHPSTSPSHSTDTSPSSAASCCSKCTGFPNFEATCKASPFYCEPMCGSTVHSWCNADGKHQECRFCGKHGQPPCLDTSKNT